MQAQKILAICVREEHYEDFLAIGKRVNRLDKSILVSINSVAFHPDGLPPLFRHLPLLTLYLVNPPATLPARGHTLFVKDLGKLEEYKNYVAAGVPVPRAMPYRIGDTVDPDAWGEYVILKPTHESLGRGVVLIPTTELNKVGVDVIPSDHLLHSAPYLLQEFIDPGPLLPGYRVVSLLGQPLMSYCWDNVAPARLPRNINESFAYSLFAAAEIERVRKLVIDDEILDFARRVFGAHADCPLQGLDIIRHRQTNALYVLENNSGGNVWSFSMRTSNPYKAFGRQAMLSQFMAWDRAAEILVNKTNALAC